MIGVCCDATHCNRGCSSCPRGCRNNTSLCLLCALPVSANAVIAIQFKIPPAPTPRFQPQFDWHSLWKPIKWDIAAAHSRGGGNIKRHQVNLSFGTNKEQRYLKSSERYLKSIESTQTSSAPQAVTQATSSIFYSVTSNFTKLETDQLPSMVGNNLQRCFNGSRISCPPARIPIPWYVVLQNAGTTLQQLFLHFESSK